MIEGIYVTRHAWTRFITRYQGLHGNLPPCPRSVLWKLLAKAQPEDLGAGAAIRLLTNGMQPARYFSADCWRFVTTEDLQRLLTVEIIVFKKPQKRKQRRRRH